MDSHDKLTANCILITLFVITLIWLPFVIVPKLDLLLEVCTR